MKYLLRIKKFSKMIYVSTTDFVRNLERSLRRAKVPLIFTQGFNPKPKFSMAPAIPLGYINKAFYIVISTEKNFDFFKVNNFAPLGLKILEYKKVNEDFKISKALWGYKFRIYVNEKALKKIIDTKEISKSKKFYRFEEVFLDLEIKDCNNGKFMISYKQSVENLYNVFKLLDLKNDDKIFILPICEDAIWR